MIPFKTIILRFLFFFLVILWCQPSDTFAQSVGLVLSGGGPRGVTHIGVLKALEENGIPIDYISGSSIGAVIGGLYASGYSPKEIETIVASDKMQEWISGGIGRQYTYFFKEPNPNASWQLFNISIDTVLRFRLDSDINAHYELDYNFLELFSGASAASGYNFDSLMIPFRCVASDISENEQIVLRGGELGKVTRASSTYPFYFHPVSIDGKLLFDGGMYNNFPVDVLIDEFSPDVIIGSKAASNYDPPNEFDLVSQVQAMLMRNTEYVVDSSKGVLIAPTLKTVRITDFSNSGSFIDSGYIATLREIPRIKELIQERISYQELEEKRSVFKQKIPEIIVGDVKTTGLNEKQDIYVQKLFKGRNKNVKSGTWQFPDSMSLKRLKPEYYKLIGDENINYVYPNLLYNKDIKKFDFLLDVEREKRFGAELGGLVSSKAINEIFFQMQYRSWQKYAFSITGNMYLGSFHNSGYLNARMDFPGRVPFFADISYTLNGWNYFNTKTYFFEDVKPIYLIQNDAFYKISFGIPVKRAAKISFDLSNGRKKDKYYQTNQFTRFDTTDVTNFDFVSPAAVFEVNSLNHKQYANRGTHLKLSGRFIYGEEENIPGSTSTDTNLFMNTHRLFQFRMIIDSYIKTASKLKFGIYAATTFTNQTIFNNYTSTILSAPAFEPIPESKTIFLPQFRAFNYFAGGVKVIVPIIKNLNFRLEAYGFQPFQEILSDEDHNVVFGGDFSARYFIGSGNLVYHAPFGPINMSLNYFDGSEEPWSFSINIGYIIFNKRPF